ncbi:hypothetical protein [Staphylococcus agnetis]|uniref:Uncharacterized protein n=1 Tax=Staphylococcus agnetis TaxID=985762 RepID=A0ABD7TTY1_9STAP|nr:hypothetical protein [Staphylococcus agnetis]UXU56516.1 hypothetical protein MUA95_08050 [Staphylococcus agnetis]UXU58836.1 hypothetical protein MUA97_08055 [Staphylococcus agnetis]UXU61161.1 hypothetical protein MUA43_08055 [Staphylococcus agnetis]
MRLSQHKRDDLHQLLENMIEEYEKNFDNEFKVTNEVVRTMIQDNKLYAEKEVCIKFRFTEYLRLVNKFELDATYKFKG